MKQVMLDLETMGLSINAPIVAIGAVAFDLDTARLGSTCYLPVSLSSAMSTGAVPDAPTILWWMSQSDEARKEVTNPAGGSRPLDESLCLFTDWFLKEKGSSEMLPLWGNGSDFDNAILGASYGRVGLRRPWSHRENRCYRTIKSLHPGVESEPYGTAHHALHDAIYQAKHLIEILGGKK